MEMGVATGWNGGVAFADDDWVDGKVVVDGVRGQEDIEERSQEISALVVGGEGDREGEGHRGSVCHGRPWRVEAERALGNHLHQQQA